LEERQEEQIIYAICFDFKNLACCYSRPMRKNVDSAIIPFFQNSSGDNSFNCTSSITEGASIIIIAVPYCFFGKSDEASGMPFHLSSFAQ
jgi:hypothetical protein